MVQKDGAKYTAQNKYDVTSEAVAGVLKKWDKFISEVPKKTVFLGFDGYVDDLYSLVRSRESPDKWERMASMKEFGARVTDTAGSSCNVERVLKKNLAGGFGPNTGRAISNLGSNVLLCGALGYPTMNPLFAQYPPNLKQFPITNPGSTAAYEFDDGKVMTTDFGNINGITWDLIMERIGRDRFIELIEKSDAIGQGHWALVPNMNNFWDHFVKDVFPNLKDPKKKMFLVDAADMKKRPHSHVIEMIQMLQKIDEFMPAYLAMNDKETADVSRVLSSNESKFPRKRIAEIKKKEDYIDFGERVNEVLNLSGIITHDPHFATITTKTKHYWITEGYTSRPKFTTAAGDHFTGGALVGLMCGLEPTEAIVIGNALTAVFVRTGISVGLNEVKRFIDEYESYILNDRIDFQL